MRGHLWGVAAVVVATTALAGCGSAQQAPAQQSLPAPVVTHTDDVSAPVLLTVDGASAKTVAVATRSDGALLPPTDISEVGWWEGSARPGSGQGSVVITGHVDDVTQGKGFAARFAGLTAGQVVSVETAGHSEHRYRVTSNRTVDKNGGLPTEELNRLTGPETLALITCGGPFVGPPLGYQDNVVVFAVPTDTVPAP